MKLLFIISILAVLGGCAQVQKADQVLNALDGSRIKLLKLTDEQLKERWNILDRTNKKDREILDSMSWADD